MPHITNLVTSTKTHYTRRFTLPSHTQPAAIHYPPFSTTYKISFADPHLHRTSYAGPLHTCPNHNLIPHNRMPHLPYNTEELHPNPPDYIHNWSHITNPQTTPPTNPLYHPPTRPISPPIPFITCQMHQVQLPTYTNKYSTQAHSHSSSSSSTSTTIPTCPSHPVILHSYQPTKHNHPQMIPDPSITCRPPTTTISLRKLQQFCRPCYTVKLTTITTLQHATNTQSCPELQIQLHEPQLFYITYHTTYKDPFTTTTFTTSTYLTPPPSPTHPTTQPNHRPKLHSITHITKTKTLYTIHTTYSAHNDTHAICYLPYCTTTKTTYLDPYISKHMHHHRIRYTQEDSYIPTPPSPSNNSTAT